MLFEMFIPMESPPPMNIIQFALILLRKEKNRKEKLLQSGQQYTGETQTG